MTIKDVPFTAEDLDAYAAGDVRAWAQFDSSVRNAWWANVDWYRSRGRERRALGWRPSRTALAEAVCHGNGHMRGVAVEKLARRRDPEVLPLLLVRCVDWVPQIRAAARAAALSKLDEPALRAMLPLVGVLSRRSVDTWMTELLLRALLADSLLEDVLSLDDRQTRRWVHDEAIRTGRLSTDRLTWIALRDNDLVVRARCGLAVLDSGDADAIRQVIAGGTVAVRAHALTLPGADVVGALAESSSLVRSMAQALVRKAGGSPVTHYRALLADGVVTPATVAGLGETGDQSDVDLLLTYVTAERPRVRGAAVRALRRITPRDPREVALPLLTDPSPYVVRQAVALLQGVITKADEGFLFSLLDPERPLYVRRGALALLRSCDSWTGLLADLRIAASSADPLAEDAERNVTRWAHESASVYTRPAPEVRAEILSLLDQAEAPATTIRFLLKRNS